MEQALETISILLQVDKTDKNLEPPGKINSILKVNSASWFLVWSTDPYASLIIMLIERLSTKSDKMVQIRTLEIYTSLLEQTIVDANPLVENVKHTDLAEFLGSKVFLLFFLIFNYKSHYF